MKHEINKHVAVLLVALMPALAVASEPAALREAALPTPVVSVFAVDGNEALELAQVRDAYRAELARLRAEYQAQVDAVLTRQTSADHS
jgi:hypothetical protein